MKREYLIACLDILKRPYVPGMDRMSWARWLWRMRKAEFVDVLPSQGFKDIWGEDAWWIACTSVNAQLQFKEVDKHAGIWYASLRVLRARMAAAITTTKGEG